ncbi:MAG: ribosomal protein S18-alanine N-acetyltransferase [Nitrospiraceae bacterium]|nr:ribosomal protein S18-alanine N-acetyltransferase [Nitrospirota bacterium]MDA8338836.1 ribosomal protein S18-alanine N-acetyltransferase [Nitrospiraceae bacterium]
MNTVYIREMYSDDIPDVVKIERLSFTTPWSETSFQSEIYSKHSITRVAELSGVIVGYVCVKHIADECHLLDLAVHPDYRKCGIATMLLDNVMQGLRIEGCRFFYLEVRASNYAARKLYEKFGFNMVGTRKGYYANPTEDAVIMMLEL